MPCSTRTSEACMSGAHTSHLSHLNRAWVSAQWLRVRIRIRLRVRIRISTAYSRSLRSHVHFAAVPPAVRCMHRWSLACASTAAPGTLTATHTHCAATLSAGCCRTGTTGPQTHLQSSRRRCQQQLQQPAALPAAVGGALLSFSAVPFAAASIHLH